jgi:two-component system phosphate regulon response regulator PhoB
MTQKKILVVEDERAIREMLAFNLGRAGYSPARGDGREARAAIADGIPISC